MKFSNDIWHQTCVYSLERPRLGCFSQSRGTQAERKTLEAESVLDVFLSFLGWPSPPSAGLSTLFLSPRRVGRNHSSRQLTHATASSASKRAPHRLGGLGTISEADASVFAVGSLLPHGRLAPYSFLAQPAVCSWLWSNTRPSACWPTMGKTTWRPLQL